MDKEYKSIGIIGAGAWGTAVSIALAKTSSIVKLWAYEQEVVDSIHKSGENSLFLPNINVPSKILVTNDFAEVLYSEALLFVTPSQFTRNICREIKKQHNISKDIPLIICSKGIETATGCLMSEVVTSEFPENNISILSGPSFAKEIANGLPTALNIACLDEKFAQKIVENFKGTNLSLFIIDDIIGAQIAGSMKNVLAIGCGIASGLNLGQNIQSALITLGIKEMGIFAEIKGGRGKTLLELCGIGDTILTCSSMESRNTSFGYKLGQGQSIESLLSENKTVTEGFATAKSIYNLSRHHGVSLILCNKIYDILYNNHPTESILEVFP